MENFEDYLPMIVLSLAILYKLYTVIDFYLLPKSKRDRIIERRKTRFMTNEEFSKYTNDTYVKPMKDKAHICYYCGEIDYTLNDNLSHVEAYTSI